ncbi:MAG: hypothetical protein D3918_16440, partial [Candidatus Electrothrix sp. AX2]|nr:hypothetical protein [Candidatus Electrothrix gigas]
YGIEVEVDGEKKTANGQMAALAMRTKDILSRQIRKQIKEATKALREAERAEEEARKKAERNGLIRATGQFIGSVVGAIYGGPAGAALGAEIGEALAEMTIGIMDNKPPMDILTGLVDNAFSIASAAGFDPEKELNAMGSKVAGEITSTLKGFEEKFKPLLAEMPKVLDQSLLQDALDVLGLEELNNVSGLSGKLYEGIKNDIGNLGQIGTMLRDASGFETADQLTDHLKKHLVSETTDLAFDDLKALAGRVGEQVEALTGDDPAARREVFEKTAKKVADKVAPLITGAIATKAGQIRQRVMKDWIGEKRGGNQFWNVPAVKEEGEKLLAHLFPENEKARTDAAVNMAVALLPPELYKGKIQQYLHPYQQKQDELIDDILDMPQPSGSGSAFWRKQVNHLREAKTKFEEKLFPFMEGESPDGSPQHTQ